MLISKYALENEQEKFIKESDTMIGYCQKSGTKDADRLLYEIWNFKADRLNMWGRDAEGLTTVKEMADYAQAHQHARGMAMAHYRMGNSYLGNRQTDEAEAHLLEAWNICYENGLRDLATRVGFSRLSLLSNRDEYVAGLALADSIEVIIEKRKEAGARIDPGTMVSLARLRCKLSYLNGDLEEAMAQRDTMERWYALSRDPALQENILYTVAGLKMYSGDLAGAGEALDSLSRMAVRARNWSKAVNYTYALADARRQDGDFEKAVDAYIRFAEAKDSAAVQASNAQLNELAQKYQLNELSWEKYRALSRLYIALLAVLLLLIVLVVNYFYTKKLKEKNQALFETITRADKLREDLTSQKTGRPETELSNEEKLFEKLRGMMVEDKPYLDSKLNREALALSLGTNTRYLSEAVRLCADGQTVSDFINSWRLREAAELLTYSDDMPVSQVCEESGFGSEATFFRIFRNHFEMTPSEYREIAREKRRRISVLKSS